LRVFAMNGSPRKAAGATDALLLPFLRGLSDSGADVRKVYLHDLKFEPCAGDRACWFRTPGKCIHRDDIDSVVPEFWSADIIVFGSPVYGDGLTSTMKAFIDRSFVAMEPGVVVRDGHIRHTLREAAKPSGKAVLVSTCGFPELDNFDPLIAQMIPLCKNISRDYAGALLRPYGSMLPRLAAMGISSDHVFRAAHRAGVELATQGFMEPATLSDISKPLISVVEYARLQNQRAGLIA